MDYLIDTHALIWYITDNKKLPLNIKEIINNKNNNCFVSIASLWEIGIKFSLGRFDFNAELEEIFQIIDDTGFEALPITTIQILQNSKLEFHHRDPFDRIIIAQAITENIILISKDQYFKEYNVKVKWEG